MKVFIAEDAALLREGLSEILQRTGNEVVGYAEDAVSLANSVQSLLTSGSEIDVLITDVRMPPTMNDDGLRAAVQLRAQFPQLGIMVLSQYVAPAYASALFDPTNLSYTGSFGDPPSTGKGGLGYLLKDRVARVADFIRSLSIVAAGGVVVDPEVAAGLVRSKSRPLQALTAREREVLELMAEGKSNAEIAAYLHLSGAAVSKHVANIFLKLNLPPGEDNRRVRAVLTYLTATSRL
ncbi:MAG: response regulator transcription factor [Actinomycetaceae bacterium]|nr:response regulator transcription factor [Actinomycetaceae bacterium]MDY6083453.1 response regulator transcription factor [Actinomycetaceae bacterium]